MPLAGLRTRAKPDPLDINYELREFLEWHRPVLRNSRNLNCPNNNRSLCSRENLGKPKAIELALMAEVPPSFGKLFKLYIKF